MSAALTVAVAGLLVAIGAGVGGYAYGIDQGKALQKGHNDATALQAVTEQITAHADLVKQSATASRSLRLAVAARQRVDESTSKELGDALTATADSRAGCVFPAGGGAGQRTDNSAGSGLGSGEVDPVAVALKDMYDLYGTCAGRLVDLLNWMDGGPR